MTGNPPGNVPDAAAIAAQVAAMMEQIGPFVDAVIGYRQRFIDAGFSDAAADRAATDLHEALMTHFRRRDAATSIAGALAAAVKRQQQRPGGAA